jgi:predicted DNA-binding transcriptional regulator AlpA
MRAESDFISATELAHLTGFARKSLYTWHSANSGPLVPILTKIGGRLGAWRHDYEAWKNAQRKMPQLGVPILTTRRTPLSTIGQRQRKKRTTRPPTKETPAAL